MKSAIIFKSRDQHVAQQNCPPKVEKQVQDFWTSCRNSSDKISIFSRWSAPAIFRLPVGTLQTKSQFSQGGLPLCFLDILSELSEPCRQNGHLYNLSAVCSRDISNNPVGTLPTKVPSSPSDCTHDFLTPVNSHTFELVSTVSVCSLDFSDILSS